jgi:hypothetical protein
MDNEINGLLSDGEKVILVVRRHYANLAPVISSIVIIYFALILMAYAAGRYSDQVSHYVPMRFVNLLFVIVILMTAFILLAALRIYRRNCLVLTDMSVMQIQQFGLFNHTVSKLSLANIEDVTSRRTGVFATVLNFGDIIVESAGEQENFTFVQAPDPSKLVEAINRAHTAMVANRRSIREQVPAAPTPVATPPSPLS